MKPEPPSDRLDEVIEESLRSEPLHPTPSGFLGRVSRAIETDRRLRRAYRIWTVRSVATLFAFIVVWVLAYAIVSSSGMTGAIFDSVPAAYGLMDQARHTIDNHLLFLVLAGLLLPMGFAAGILREYRSRQRAALTYAR